MDRLDALIATQVEAIRSHPHFVAVERSWRSLAFLIERVDLGDAIVLEIVTCTKREMASACATGGALDVLLNEPFRAPIGLPYGVVIVDFDVAAEDTPWLAQVAAIAARAHAPVLFGIDPSIVDELLPPWAAERVDEDADVRDLEEVEVEVPGFRTLRNLDASRYLGLCLPRFELVPGVWGRANVALAVCIARSFARYRWCPNITGSVDGEVVGIRLNRQIGDRMEWALSLAGLIALVPWPGDACFHAACSLLGPRSFGESDEERQRWLDFWLSQRLPYLFIVARLAHYIKVIYRDEIFAGTPRSDIVTVLDAWIARWVADARMVTPSSRGRCPLRRAEISVDDGHFVLNVRPHFKYFGAFFSLSLAGVLEARSGPRDPPLQA